jgi:hypothetical protein
VNNSFLDQFNANIKFSYFCFDRVIIRGYIRHLFFAGGVAILLKVLGFKQTTSGVMRILTDQLNAHIEKVAKQRNIPILWWPSQGGGTDGAKLDFVKKKYANAYTGKGDHVYCIITDKEPTRTFASREFTTKNGESFHKLYDCRKPVKQYYIYFHDGLLGGPCYLKICSYLPFQCEFYFNGHNAAKLKMDKEGLGYAMKDNAFVGIENRERFKEIVKELDGRAVQQRVEHWKNIFFKFDKGAYSTRSKHLEHEWYLHQVEVSSNIVFKAARFATSLFERLLDKFQRIGLPDSIARIFSLRNNSRTKSKTFWKLYENKAVIKHWFRRNSVKQYNKTGYFLRTETTINNPKSLGLQKPAIYLQAYLWKGVEANDKFLSCCSDVDVSTITEDEHLQFTSPVPDHKGKNIAAPDFRKKRQSALARELLKPKYCVHGFKTKDILEALPGSFKNLSQIRHELLKLRVRGVIQKNKKKSFYRVTRKGWSLLWVEFTARHHFKNPMISKNFKKEAARIVEQPSKIEEAYALIDQGLSQLTQELAIAA